MHLWRANPVSNLAAFAHQKNFFWKKQHKLHFFKCMHCHTHHRKYRYAHINKLFGFSTGFSAEPLAVTGAGFYSSNVLPVTDISVEALKNKTFQ